MAKSKHPSPKRDIPLHDLAVERRAVASLKPYARNARTHSKKQIYQIAASIQEFGFTNSILIRPDGQIIAGHGRVEAAKLLGLAEAPAIALANLSEAQERALRMADNKLALNAGWDLENLRFEIIELADLELDLEITGFETAEMDLVIDGPAAPPKGDPADEVPDAPAVAVTRPGDLWLLGEHRLLCDNALQPEAFTALMGDDRARLVFSDPPYNVPIDGHVCGAGKVKHREFAMASGEMSRDEFIGFLTTVFGNLAAVSVDGAIQFQCMDWRHLHEILEAGRAAKLDLKNLCVWAKDNGGMGSFYRSQHELVLVFKHGTAPHVNTVELGKMADIGRTSGAIRASTL